MNRRIGDLSAHNNAMFEPFDQSASLIGLCLDGVDVREAAKKLGTKLRRVITLGTPFNESTDHARMGWVYRLLNAEPPASDIQLFANNYAALHWFSSCPFAAVLTWWPLRKHAATTKPVCAATGLETLKL